MTTPVQTAVEQMIDGRSNRRPLVPLSETQADLTLDRAYVIQDALRSELDRRGERPIGWKLGATSAASQTAMGLKEPICGFLFARRFASGAEVSVQGFVGLAVEAEVAFRIGTTLAGPGVTAATALLAVDGAAAALELPDLMFSGKPGVPDFIANSIIANAVVLGSFAPLGGLDLAAEAVVIEHNGEVVGTHTASEVLGNPLNALAWLANHLATRGLALQPGDVVMSGAISKVLRPKAGDTIEARFAHLGSVSVKVVT